MKRSDWISLVALIVSFVVGYRQFFAPADLSSEAVQINVLPMASSAKQSLGFQILIDDLIADRPSQSAIAIAERFPQLKSSKDRLVIGGLLTTLSKEAHSAGNPLNYDPPKDMIEKYIGSKEFTTGFHVPLVIRNDGARVGFVASLVLSITNTQSKERWLLVPFYELNLSKMLETSSPKRDLDFVKNVFSGLSIAPATAERVDPVFLPFHQVKDQILSKGNVGTGNFTVLIIGYSPSGEELFRTTERPLKLNADTLRDSFSGTTAIKLLVIEDHLLKARNIQ